MPRDILEEYKKEYNMKTSEEVFDFQKPAENQCPNIDSLIKSVRDIERLSNRHDGDVDELVNRLSDISSYIFDFESELEKFREAISSVRTWGLEWKSLAKQMIESHEIEIDTLI